ncbi:la-related protein 6b [Ctenopharyngodon idella]|uniref:la-related protein 6b n=1 Tax=Ctenopharyngodon idella TaxID=7959 RepID=UPI00222FF298|nr:la-related protein 6b [Ctenopharyngodon idella]XP_051768649.1 la-related protein 6b [Ctenopharyngodon idella]
MSSPGFTDIFHCEDTQQSKGLFSYTDDGLNDSLDGSSTELTDVFEEEFCEGELWIPPNDDLTQKIAAQLENYLSDENLSDDAFLLKHVQRNKMGYVSLKLLTSFKKIRDLTRDWRTTLAAARTSPLLEVNEIGTKVRRRTPVPDWLLCIPTSKLLLAWNFLDGVGPVKDELNGSPGGEQLGIMEAAMRVFSPYGTISSLRILRPGKEIPAELKRYTKKHLELGRKVCAVVEYEYLEGARKAYEALKAEEQGGRGICVVLLGSRGTRKPGWSQNLVEEESEEGIDNDSLKKPNRKARRYIYSLEDSAVCSSSESDFAPASPRPNRRVSRPQALYGSPLAIPRISTFRSDPYRNPLCSPVGSPLLPRKLFPCSHVTSPLATHPLSSTPTAAGTSSFSRYKGSDELSPDDLGFTSSPWVQRRKNAAQVIQPEMGSLLTPSQIVRSLSVLVVRQPVGPDGTKGFHNCIGRGKVLLPH